MTLGAGGLINGLQVGSLVGVLLHWGVIAVASPWPLLRHPTSTCKAGVNKNFYPNQRVVKRGNSCPKIWTKGLFLTSIGMN